MTVLLRLTGPLLHFISLLESDGLGFVFCVHSALFGLAVWWK